MGREGGGGGGGGWWCAGGVLVVCWWSGVKEFGFDMYYRKISGAYGIHMKG